MVVIGLYTAIFLFRKIHNTFEKNLFINIFGIKNLIKMKYNYYYFTDN
ncbi:hypothetical protein BC670_1797 [Flavobacterium branchiophilum]|uniref:Uncharacterized protein n=1 Tax=Flavobacterium branchiophilum TaxID=55197 RepID=A0A543G453_9FLAO|nr:hypothetical protein BC670_1797 [Flavobacterium branchiophilum]